MLNSAQDNIISQNWLLKGMNAMLNRIVLIVSCSWNLKIQCALSTVSANHVYAIMGKFDICFPLPIGEISSFRLVVSVSRVVFD